MNENETIDKPQGYADADTIEQKRDLFALEQMAGAEQLPGQTSDETGGGGPAPGRDLEAELNGLITLAVGLVGPVFPTLKEVYTADTIGAAATVTAELCNKHGWLQDTGITKYGEEIAAAAVLGPLAFSTYAAISADLDKMRTKKPKKPAEAKPAEAATLPALEFGPSNDPALLPDPKMAYAGTVMPEPA